MHTDRPLSTKGRLIAACEHLPYGMSMLTPPMGPSVAIDMHVNYSIKLFDL